MLTDRELAVLDLLTKVAIALEALPEFHPEDWPEMRLHIHALQEKVMCRAAVRAHPKVFYQPEGDE